MDQSEPINVVGIISKNSIDYIDAMFQAYSENKIAIPVSNIEFGKRFKILEFQQIIEPGLDTGWYNKSHDLIHSDDLAQISFTSGTEGEPKGIILTHNNLADVTERINKVMQVTSEIREYVGVPVYYSFGFGRIRACTAAGGKSYIPRNGFNPLEIIEMLKADQINAISAVPTLWRIILNNPSIIGKLGEKIRWIEIGSQYMSGDEKEQMKKLFPNAKIAQHYGLTEASRSSILDISATEGGALESVGKPADISNIDISVDGRIRIRGPHVANQMITGDGMASTIDHDGWLTTNDLGKIEDGYLYFMGRADDIINCGGIKVSPDLIEKQIYKSLEINSGIAVARIADPIRGDGILIALENNCAIDSDELKILANKILKKMGVQAGDSLKIVKTEKIPTTETGKVKRNELPNLIEKSYQEETAVTNQTISNTTDNITDEQEKLCAIWREVLEVEDISIHSSFYDYGGDSLSAINLTLTMERLDVPRQIAQDIINGKSIAQVTEDAPHSDQSAANGVIDKYLYIATTSEAINAVRGIMVLLLLFIRWSPGVLKRLSLYDEGLLNPLFRLGTPGFAIVFGISVGFYFFHQFGINKAKTVKNIRVAQILLVCGIGTLALMNYLNLIYADYERETPMLSYLVYSVLFYYLLAVSSISIWYKILTSFKNTIAATLVGAAIMFLLQVQFKVWNFSSQLTENGWYLFGRMLEGKYSYFTMTGMVFCGLSIGLYIRNCLNEQRKLVNFLPFGAALILFGIIISIENGEFDKWQEYTIARVWMIITYVGVVLTMLSISLYYNTLKNRNKLFLFIYRILAILGLLSLPMYVGHRLVVPAKDLLLIVDVPGIAAIAVPALVFFGLIGYWTHKLYRVYYSVSK